MALPTAETKQETAATAATAATAEVAEVAPEETLPIEGAIVQESGKVEPIEGVEDFTAEPVSPEQKALTVAQGSGVDPIKNLADMGIEDIKLDFTSFPKITLEKGNFSSAEHKNFGTEFEFVYMSKHPNYLFSSVPSDRDTEAEIVYSDDGEHDNATDKTKAEIAAEWKSKGWGFRETKYDIVIGLCMTGPHADEFVQLQISPMSQGALGGYLYSLSFKGEDPRKTVARISAGPEMGKGQRAFTPWIIKKKK